MRLAREIPLPFPAVEQSNPSNSMNKVGQGSTKTIFVGPGDITFQSLSKFKQ